MLRRLSRNLPRNKDGVAMVEFAIVMPVLLIMFIGSFVCADMISCYRKVSITTRALTDLVSRNISPSAGVTSATTYLNSAGLVLSPFNTANSVMQITLMRVCDATHAYVIWSQQQGGSRYTTWATNNSTKAMTTPAPTSIVSIPANMVTGPMVPTSTDGSDVCYNTPAVMAAAANPGNKTQVGTLGAYLYYGQVGYAYTPVVGYDPTASTVTTTVMTDQLYMSPRLN